MSDSGRSWGDVLLAVERVAVTVAALAALFPLWQFWTEREHRKIERMAVIIGAQKDCEEMNQFWIEFDQENPAAPNPWNFIGERCKFISEYDLWSLVEEIESGY